MANEENSFASELVVHAGGQPENTDPLTFDSLVHHSFQRPLFSTLVSEHKIGGIRGLIAESWSSENQDQTWIFKIRQGMTFSSGKPLTAEAVAKSLNRMSLLLKQRDSGDGLLEFLLGFDRIKAAHVLIEGISHENDHLFLRFQKPMSHALSYISFGQYAVVSEDDFDSLSGAWKDPSKAVASGPYEVAQWSETKVMLKLRKEYPADLIHPRPFQHISFVWLAKDKENIMVRAGENDYPFSDTFKFIESPKSGIRYIRVVGYRNANHPLHRKELRVRFRDLLFLKLKTEGFPVTKSFIPLGIDGTREAPHNTDDSPIMCSGHIRIYKYPAFVPYFQRAPELMAEVATELGLTFEFVCPSIAEYRSAISNPENDPIVHLSTAGTGINLHRPKDDLRFMVKSKEGIQLADPTGRLAALVDSDDFEIQRFNEILNEEAFVWPVMHSSGNIWLKPELVDSSLLNPEPPPTDLALLGRPA